MNSKAETDYQVKTKDAWYKHYPRDYIEGTRRLTLEERGAYADIIDLLYIHGGKLPDDPKWMGCAMHVSTRKWRVIRDALIAHKKIESVDGHIVNARVAFELHSRLVQARTNAETATNRERTKRENREKINEINETEARKQHHIRVRVREEEKESKIPPLNPPPPGGEVPQLVLATPEQPASAKQRSNRGSRLPADWSLPDAWRAWTQAEFPTATERDVELQGHTFRDYWIAQSGAKGTKLDWEATWRNWCRRSFARVARSSSSDSYSARPQAQQPAVSKPQVPTEEDLRILEELRRQIDLDYQRNRLTQGRRLNQH